MQQHNPLLFLFLCYVRIYLILWWVRGFHCSKDMYTQKKTLTFWTSVWRSSISFLSSLAFSLRSFTCQTNNKHIQSLSVWINCGKTSPLNSTEGWDLAEWSERCASTPQWSQVRIPVMAVNQLFVLICCWPWEVAVREHSLWLPVCCVTRVPHCSQRLELGWVG
jgi:hypothetical protein